MPPSERQRWPLIGDKNLRPRFKQSMDFSLTDAEVAHLQGRLTAREKGGPRSLFHELVLGSAQVDQENPKLDGIKTRDPRNGTILRNAKAFSELTWGASLSYNILLLERRIKRGVQTADAKKVDEETLESRKQDWKDWMETDRKGNANLVLDPSFFKMPNCLGDESVAFVCQWAQEAAALRDPDPVYRLIAHRERDLKSRSQQRFQSDRALSRWGGASDISPASFRWPTARTFLKDLGAEGIKCKGGTAK